METKGIVSGRSVGDIWLEYIREDRGNKTLRNLLIEYYLPSVRLEVKKIFRKVPKETDLDDFVSIGVFGLMCAVERFDLSFGISFQVYCAPWIRRAILNELREIDWIPRFTRHRIRECARLESIFFMEFGRKPTDEEVQDILGVSTKVYLRTIRDSRRIYVNSDISPVDKAVKDPSDEIMRKELHDAMMRVLDPRARLILLLYYFEGYTMEKIARILFLSLSSIRQIHPLALKKIKSNLSIKALWKGEE